MTTTYDTTLKTPIGWIALRMQDAHVQALAILPAMPPVKDATNSVAERIVLQIQKYLDTGNWPENIPLDANGTAFQKKVWAALLQIPPGHTKTYGELARQLGTSARAIGGACRANPIPLLIPCHRVVAAHGDGGFAGHTACRWMDIKRRLLQLEVDG